MAMKGECGCNNFPKILGRGKCDRHNSIYHMSNHKNICPRCADEDGLCKDCGKHMIKEKDSSMEDYADSD